MRERFNRQLACLHKELIEMGNLCEKAISLAMKELFKYELSFSMEENENEQNFEPEMDETEKDINEKEKSIESLCMKIILQQQPVARDLRMISAALKMIIDMERIGDQAFDISEIAKFVNKDLKAEKTYIKEMSQEAINMVTKSIDSYVKNDLEKAKQVIQLDDSVDYYFDLIKRDLTVFIRRDIEHGEKAIDLIMIAKYLERIGDHAVNIAESVIFSITGE